MTDKKTNDNIDYKSLLFRYMELVWVTEGTTCIDDIFEYGDVSKKEASVLTDMADKLINSK